MDKTNIICPLCSRKIEKIELKYLNKKMKKQLMCYNCFMKKKRGK